MAVWRRLVAAVWVWVTIAITGIIHYRVGVEHLYPLATEQYKGPFSSVVSQLEAFVPVILLVLGLGVLLWVIAAGVQEERARYQGGRY